MITMKQEEIIRLIKQNKQEYDALLLLLFSEDGFSFSPVDRPHFVIMNQDDQKNKVLRLSGYSEDAIIYELRDGSNLNLCSSYGNNVSCFMGNKKEIEKGRLFFNHPEHLYGYITKTGNRVRYEIIYDRSKEKGITRITEYALLEYIEYFKIESYEDLQVRISSAYDKLKNYSIEIQNNEAEFMYSDVVLKRIREKYGKDAINIQRILAYKLNSNLFDIYSENNRFKQTSGLSNGNAIFVGDESAISWVMYQEYLPKPIIYTKLKERISIVNPKDEIPDLIQIIAWEYKATEIRIATGYMFDSGINMIQRACSTVVNGKGKIELLIGSLQTYRPGTKQKMVNRNTADMINALCKLPYYTVMTYPDRFYHGKYYYISNGETTYVITGSSNVTSTAYRTNRELDVIFRFDSKDDPLLFEFENWYSDLKNKSVVITDLDINLFDSNLIKDDQGNKHGASYYRNLTSEEERARYRFLENLNPTKVEIQIFNRKRDFKAFANYIAFVFEEKAITILECFSYGNSSYIFSTSDIKEIQNKLCRKSKDQVQKESIYITSVSHDDYYEQTINSIMK